MSKPSTNYFAVLKRFADPETGHYTCVYRKSWTNKHIAFYEGTGQLALYENEKTSPYIPNREDMNADDWVFEY